LRAQAARTGGGSTSGVARLVLTVFAATLIGIGLCGLATGGYTGTWAPGPRGPERGLFAVVCALVACGAGLGLLWRRSAALAAGLFTAYVLAWMLAVKAPALALSPATVEESCGESAVLAAASWVLLIGSAGPRSLGPLGLAAGAPGLRCARTL
jgi:hypothetical protein